MNHLAPLHLLCSLVLSFLLNSMDASELVLPHGGHIRASSQSSVNTAPVTVVTPTDAPWTPIAWLNDDTPPEVPGHSAMAAGPNGDICAIFPEWAINPDQTLDYSHHILRSRCRPSGEDWGSVETLYDAPSSVAIRGTAISVDAAGNAYAVWADDRANPNPYNPTCDVYFAYRPTAGTWQPSVRVNDGDPGSARCWTGLSIAVDTTDAVHILWLDAHGAGGHVRYRGRGSDGSWQASEQVTDVGSIGSGYMYPDIIADTQGNLYAVFADSRPWLTTERYPVLFDHRPANGQWGTDEAISGAFGGDLNVAVDEARKVYVAYDTFMNRPYQVKLSARGASGTWSAPETAATELPNTMGNRLIPSIAVSWAGDVYLVWTDSAGPKGKLFFRLRRPESGWQPQETVWGSESDAPGWTTEDGPSIGIDDSGQVYVGWPAGENPVGGDNRAGKLFSERPAPIQRIRCQTKATTSFTQYYGLITLTDGTPAPVGTVVRAFSPRGNEVGCMQTTATGYYGYLRVYGEDTALVPPIPGMRPGEPVSFKIDFDTVTSYPALITWHDDRFTHEVHLGHAHTQSFNWASSWNLFSIAVDPPDHATGAVLNSATGQYDLVVGKAGTYAPPPANPVYNTLNQLTYGQAYWIRTTAPTSIAAGISGFSIDPTTPINLGNGWEWIGYLPHTPMPIATALASIGGKYDRVVGQTGSYNPPPADPVYNTLSHLEPDQGYLIHMTASGSLTYPATVFAQSEVSPQSAPLVSSPAEGCPSINITPWFTEYYGHVTVDGVDAPIGIRVTARNPRGDLVGCTVTTHPGVFGYMRVYGEDATANLPIPGMRDGETPEFWVDGREATAIPLVIWYNDWVAHEMALAVDTSQEQVTQIIALHLGGTNWFSFNVKPPIQPPAACSGVTPTSAFTTVYGNASLADAAAAVGDVVEAYSPAGVKVGCFEVTTTGLFCCMCIYGAEGATPGMVAGEPVVFKINNIAAQPTPGSFVWQDDKQLHEVDLDAPDAIPVETLLAPIANQVSKLQCQTGTYRPLPADPRFNTCTTVAPGQGYLLYATANTAMYITGRRVPTDQPIPLHAGYNWLGYLPTCELPVATALAGLAGSYDILHSEAGTYRPPPANPAYNNFSTMAPDRGYMIHVTAAVTLTYPAGLCGAAVQEAPHTPPAADCPALATGRFTTFYGQMTPGASPVPVAAPVWVYTPRDEVVGCGQTNADGSYGYLRVYGADGDLPGAQPGEPLRFTVAGVTALAAAVPTWTDDFGVQRLDLTLAAQPLYLPLLRREGARP